MACIIERDGSTGYDWCRRRNKKKKKSQTSGSQKGLSCQATSLERYMAKKNRSYKHDGYENWCNSHQDKK